MKRSLAVPVVGLGVGAAALGGAAFVGGGARCAEGRVVESLAQCRALVGAASANVCASAFGAFSPAAERLSLSGDAPPAIADRAVFLTTGPDSAPTARPVTRLAGDAKWRDATGSVADAFRNNCSRARYSSYSSSSPYRSSSRSYWSSWSGGSGVASAASSVSRGGFGSSGRSFSFKSGG